MKKAFLLLACITVQVKAQTSWTKDANNPVLKRDTVMANLPNDIIAISDCWVIKEGDLYKMWYTCGGLNYPADTLLRSRQCYATSPDGINWTKYSGNPVLDVSYTGDWDSLGVETATVITDISAPENERYKMWYAGQYYNSYRYDIGYATSPDGMNWTKYGSPVLQVGAASEWDNGFLEGPSVIKDGSVYKMWYCGYDATVDVSGTDGQANIGYASSTDGINWTKHINNPVVTVDLGSWDAVYVQDPHVIKDGDTYFMWYGGNEVDGYGQQVGFATSQDGITWFKSELNPVLERGDLTAWDASTASFPSVIKEDDRYEMWYTGKDVAEPMPYQLDYYWEIGHAASMITGIHEIINPENGLITLAPNPAERTLQIQMPVELNNAELKIFNSSGQIEISISGLSGRNIHIETTGLKNGLYFLTIQHDNLQMSSKFLINK